MQDKALIALFALFLGSVFLGAFLVHGLQDPKIPLCPPKVSWRQEGTVLEVFFSKEVEKAWTICRVPLRAEVQGKEVKVFLPESSLKEYLGPGFALPCRCSVPFTLEAVLEGKEEACLHLAFEISLSPPEILPGKVKNPNPIPAKIFTSKETFSLSPGGEKKISGEVLAYEVLGKKFYLPRGEGK